MNPRTNTPDERTVAEDGTVSTRIRLKRACNGCGTFVGDPDERDFDERGRLTDVRGECPNCRPVVELEAQGCEARRLTPRSIGALWRWIEAGKPFYVEDPTNAEGRADGTPRGLKVDGLSVYSADRRHVARFGDWIIRWPDGRWTVHHGPEAAA